ncbi:hypothetical protein [Streptomyces sp.]|uniref:hypothetical protein n=1 Tax=Streptomyces sp. TaxID=1931 RepID=UPI0039C91D9A
MSNIQELAQRRDRRQVSGWAGIGAVTLGIFCVLTAELLPVGLLTPVGAALVAAAGLSLAAVPAAVRTGRKHHS